MAIPNPNPNIADGVKCDNKTYSSNKVADLLSGKQDTLETKDYTISLATNSYVSPFLTYFETDISADIPAGKQVASVVIHASATNPCTFTTNNLGKLRIYGTKEEDVYVLVTFI